MIDFVRYRFVAILFSAVLVFGTIGLYFYKTSTRGYAFTYSIDFTGGTQVLLGFSQDVTMSDLKEVLAKNGWGNAAIREFSKKEYLVRVQDFSDQSLSLGDRIEAAVAKEMPNSGVVKKEVEAVGPGVGVQLKANSLKVLFFAILFMLLYIAWRFASLSYAAGAIVALCHDAFIMWAAFLIFDREISNNLVAAIVMILGYSINDTIVIFSQIRHGLKTMKGIPLKDVVNDSLNYTLRRTILTSISTALVVLSIYIFGGEVLNDFAFALLIGIVFGTYSSIFIASPVMMALRSE